jgi:hypothetical protein
MEQRSEVRGQRSEVRGQRSEVRGQRSEVRGQRKRIAISFHCIIERAAMKDIAVAFLLTSDF